MRSRGLGRIIEAVGWDGFRALQKYFGGRKIWIPKRSKEPSCGLCLCRDDCVSRWSRMGVSVVKISKFVGVSVKRIYQILPAGERQSAA